MKRRFLVTDGQPALGLIEEAFVLLRQVRWSSWLWYLVGTLPLFVGVLYVWSDLSTSPFAGEHLPESAALMLALFLLAKAAQIGLVDQLSCLAYGLTPQAWTGKRFLAATTLTLVFQPLGLFLIPIALVLTLPSAWVVSFYQSLVVMAGQPDLSPRQSASRAWRLTKLWPVQNHAILSILSLFGAAVFLNLLALSFALPQAAKMLAGVESALTRSPWSTLNSTVLASLFGLTLLILDPLTKAVYVLRCFYGASTRSGEDLLVTMRSFQRLRSVWIAGLLCLGAPAGSVQSAPIAVPPPATQVSPQELDAAIQTTLAKREYVWRLPRDLEVEATSGSKQHGFWSQFWSGLERGMKRFGEAVNDLFQRVEAVIKKFFGSTPAPTNPSKVTFDWLSPFRLLALVLLVGLLLVMVVFGWRLWRRRSRPNAVVDPNIGVSPAVDLTDERVQANQLPQEGWLALAQELTARGEFRLAMRAFYLSTLARLAQRNLINLAASKSNRDYLRDLGRRAHALPKTYDGFAEHVASFERVWYGDHPIDSASLDGFARRTEALKEGQS